MNPAVVPPEPELTEAEAALYLGISRFSLRRSRLAGVIKPTRTFPFGGRRYSVSDLENFRSRCARRKGA